MKLKTGRGKSGIMKHTAMLTPMLELHQESPRIGNNPFSVVSRYLNEEVKMRQEEYF